MNATLTRPERPGDPLLCSGCVRIWQRADMAVCPNDGFLCPDCMSGSAVEDELEEVKDELKGTAEEVERLEKDVGRLKRQVDALRQLLVPFAKLARAVHPGYAADIGLYPSIVGESSPAKVSDLLAALNAVKDLVPATVPPLNRKGGAA